MKEHRGAIGVRELKTHASRILRGLRDRRGDVAVTYHGRVIAHFVAAEDYERLTAAHPDFWGALQAFRQRTGLAPLRIGEAFRGARSYSKGRRFTW